MNAVLGLLGYAFQLAVTYALVWVLCWLLS